MTNRNSDSPNIAYFAMRQTLDGEGHFGAALVVDGKGIPQEFRCTVPIRPSAVQIALYGATIHNFIAFDLCGQQLLGSLTTGPSACVVESEPELGLQEYTSLPVFHAKGGSLSGIGDSGGDGRTRNARRSGNGASSRRGSKARLTDSDGETPEGYVSLDSSAGFPTILMGCNQDWSWALDDFLPDLQNLFSSINLIEPFERITAGCRLICQQDKRFK